jgi:hypothetical protein
MEKERTPELSNNVSPIVPPFKDVSQYKFTLSWAFILGAFEATTDVRNGTMGYYERFIMDW